MLKKASVTLPTQYGIPKKHTFYTQITFGLHMCDTVGWITHQSVSPAAPFS